MIESIPLHRITREVCQEFEISLREIRQANRTTRVVQARQQLCYRLRLTGLYSYPKIAEHIGRDHTTVRHAVIACMQPEDFAKSWMPQARAKRYAAINGGEPDKDFV